MMFDHSDFHIRRFYYALLTMSLFTLVTVADSLNDDGIKDFRLISYDDVTSDESINVYENPNIGFYHKLVIDVHRDQLLVGARDNLLRLDLVDLRELERVEWKPSNTSVALCQAKGQKMEDCHNFVRVVHVKKDNLVFTCGTNAFNPQCTWREVRRLKQVRQVSSGVGKCPYSPHHNSTSLLTSDGNYYSATVTDFLARDPAICRLIGPAPRLSTSRADVKWLNDPDFVSSYEIGDFVYFFFRETALEYSNCGKAVYPRVARICKNDRGGDLILERTWTTFNKARLNCSIAGDFPFYYSHLQSTFYLPAEHLLYAVFTTSAVGLYGSAVCVYNMSAILKAFDGPYKYQQNADSTWKTVPNGTPRRVCGNNSPKRSVWQELANPEMTSQNVQQRRLMDAQKYQLMNDAVQPMGLNPVLSQHSQRWLHIVVDAVRTLHHQTMHVVYVSTLAGTIRKLVSEPGTGNTCLLEELQVVSADARKGGVKSLILSKQQKALFVGTTQAVLRIPFQRCHRFKTKLGCMSSMDPYCGWSILHHQCRPIPNEFIQTEWHQHKIRCPTLELEVDGGWSDWSKWTACQHLGYGRHGDQCFCRHRTCDSPAPSRGGRDCRGQFIEVNNCTVNGGWTQWSTWSGCSTSCGVAVKSRSRTCGNPSPQFGGHVCVGPSIDEQYCHQNPPCPQPTRAPVFATWSSWGTWMLCSAPCGGGMQHRRRICSSNAVGSSHGGNHLCLGNNAEWRTCNTHMCDEVRKFSEWSSWTEINTTRSGYAEQRFRSVCRARVPDAALMRASPLRRDLRYCPTVRGVASCDRQLSDKTPPQVLLVSDKHPNRWSNYRANRLHKSNSVPTVQELYKQAILRKRRRNRKKSYYSQKPTSHVRMNDGVISADNVIQRHFTSGKRVIKDAVPNKCQPPKKKQRKFCYCRNVGDLRICRKCKSPVV